MSNKDFQNGFALGYTSGGVVSEKILDHTVTFTVDGEPYEVVSVKDGNSVNEPIKPKISGLECVGWSDSEGSDVSFPITPTENITITAKLTECLAQTVVEHIGLNYDEYPYIVISVKENSSGCYVYAFKELCAGRNNKALTTPNGYAQIYTLIDRNTDITNIHSVVSAILNSEPQAPQFTTNSVCSFLNFPCFANFDFEYRDENTTLFV